MNTYVITLLPHGDKMLPYTITVHDNTSEAAIIKAKQYVAVNGYWPNFLSTEEIMNLLEVDNIVTST